jgi:uncharacterized membrane protein YeaQ/YmgE (transglycosylase-associated protein family)
MGILAWILMGLLAGVVAKWLMPGKGPAGWIWTILLGIAGALVGGFVGTHLLEWGTVDSFNPRSIALAIGGSVLVLFVYDRFLRK